MPAPTASPSGTPLPELESELLGLAGHIAAAECRFLQLLAEFDDRGGWAGVGIRSCAHWLSWRAGMSLRTATEHLRVARALTTLPRITEAFAAGRISYSKVRALTRITGSDSAALARIAAATATTPAHPDPDPDPDPDPTPPTPPAGSTESTAPTCSSTATGPTEATTPIEPTGSTAPTMSSAPTGSPAPTCFSAATTGGPTARTGPTAPGAVGHAGSALGSDAGSTGTDHPAPTAPETGVADPETVERVLLDLALSGTAGHVETVVRAVRRRVPAPTWVAARRSVSWYHDVDGSLVLRGRLAPEEGAALIAAIEGRVSASAPAPTPTVPTAPTGPTGPVDLDTRPAGLPSDLDQRGLEQAPGPAVDRIAARRADALVDLVRHRDAGDGAGPVVERGTAHVVVHLDVASGTARLADGPEIPGVVAERLACDARAQLLLDDRAGNRLHLGRSRRLASPAQIAALTARDVADGGGCRFPGCPHDRHLHAHHVRHWLHGGSTDVDNLVLICGHHHRLVHDHGYRVRYDQGRWVFRRPDGTLVPGAGDQLDGNTDELVDMHVRARIAIDRDSLTPAWYGDRLDPEPILDALLPPVPPAAAAA
ncbi:HNH endonuclease signature motif containing protein [Pseudonocardia sp. HH130630-07]|uniref:HNH endonuclease signature motif containing protein n=1 Tax=Pseudonocardia sp. HH130630-07 TaxID=1690815 RepID=UPI0008151E40|nr:HNH endonuclease signature motif containing protein [Pseudonocardia sp. HH130630-07]ANY07123.1 hypothetical protein AFB00_13440 [Pseudonocardia sp. HH130630-07]